MLSAFPGLGGQCCRSVFAMRKTAVYLHVCGGCSAWCWLRAVLVCPVSSRPVLRHLMHRGRPDLHLQGHIHGSCKHGSALFISSMGAPSFLMHPPSRCACRGQHCTRRLSACAAVLWPQRHVLFLRLAGDCCISMDRGKKRKESALQCEWQQASHPPRTALCSDW